MNSLQFKSYVVMVIIYFACLIIIGLYLGNYARDEFEIFKELTSLYVAIPAAWLTYCFQRRQAYLKDVRDLWTKLVTAVQDAIQYTHLDDPPQSEFARVQKNLSITIEEVRGVFANIGETEEIAGLYPFESLKEIQAKISALKFGDTEYVDPRKKTRMDIIEIWKNLRKHYLSNCARGLPIRPDSPYLK